MHRYEITKYFNSYGEIKEQEWISIHDIGGTFGNVKLTQDKYIKVENSFVKSIKEILEFMGISRCKIKDLRKASLLEREDVFIPSEIKELYTKDILKIYKDIENGDIVDMQYIEAIIRLQLREDIGCMLHVPYRFKLYIGYDYMVGVDTSKDLTPIFKNIEEQGLYIFEFY